MTPVSKEAPLAARDIASIKAGDTAKLVKKISDADIAAFAQLSGDRNPLHVDAEFARGTSFQRPVAHGMILASYVSTLVGMHLPGPGALWSNQSFRWLKPVFAGDEVEVTLRVTQVSVGANTLTIEVSAVNQSGAKVMEGEGSVMLLTRTERKGEKALSERVALVSGSSRGIGAATAFELARAGACVGVNYLTQADAARSLCRAIGDAGGHALAVQADVTNPDAVAEAVDRLSREFGKPVDVVVNNASIPPVAKPFLELAWQEVQEMIDVSVRGAFNCARAALPKMLETGSGVIVNIGSALNHGAPPAQWTAFVTAKAALLAMTRSLAVEFGPKGIRVNMVSPGTTETDSIAAIPERLRKVQAMQTPLRRLAAPEDVARTVAFLCSEAGQYITGADIPVSGGATI
ncbi:MAG: SDR family oxidoreductase [Bryobacteraceae bacterium]